MTASVLVLDRTFMPVSQTTWKRAIRLILLDKAELVTGHVDKLVRSAGKLLKYPAVIRLFTMVQKKRGVRYCPENIYLRDKGKCSYCRAELTIEKSTRDHVLPQSRGGKTTWENTVLCCFPCNQKKGDKTPQEAGMRLATKPVKPHSLPPRLRIRGELPAAWATFMPWAG